MKTKASSCQGFREWGCALSKAHPPTPQRKQNESSLFPIGFLSFFVLGEMTNDKMTNDKMTKTTAYKDGLQTGLEDWCITGNHRSRKPPQRMPLEKRTQWFLGRCHGFQEAEKLLEKKDEKK